ncbi:MAG: MGDG synthase family glycosyltransferase [Anaerolineae bacterium]|jgi:UDP-N-acetylglucosamine:LPS N-acetylglucosamine transferase
MSAAQAIADALQRIEPDASAEIVDVLAGCNHFPLNQFPRLYGPFVTNLPRVWLTFWRLSDYPRAADAVASLLWPLLAEHLRDLVREHSPDVMVPIHPLLVRPAVRLSEEGAGLPVACIVTDLVRLHAFWLYPPVDRYLLSTDEAARATVAAGVPPERVVVCGQPIHPGAPASLTRHAARRALGLDEHAPIVLVTGGGAGAGPLLEVAEKLDEQLESEVQLAVICGRNERVRQRLEGRTWRRRAQVLGYVADMPTWLRATDLLVTKAGPSALAEAMAEGLPTVIMSALPGQETDNVRYFCGEGAAIWAPRAAQVCQEVATLLREPARAQALAARARAVAHPDSARLAAEALLELAVSAGVPAPA